MYYNTATGQANENCRMACVSRLVVLLLAIAAAHAFQAPAPNVLSKHVRSMERVRVRSRAPLSAEQILRPAVVVPAFLPGADVFGSVRPVDAFGFVQPAALPVPGQVLSPNTVVGATILVALIKLSYVLSTATPASLSLLAHACAGMLGGLAALFGDTAVSKGLGEAQKEGFRKSMKFTAITKAVNSVTFAYISAALRALGSSGFIVAASAAAGTGVVFTGVQSLFAEEGRREFFRENVVRNVLALEAFWLTFTALGMVSPVFGFSGTYTGLAMAGAVCGLVSALVASVKVSFEGGLRGARMRLIAGCRTLMEKSLTPSSRAAIQGGVLFVVYQAVYTTLIHT